MKCAKSVNVKKRARSSGSVGTGLSGCRPASSATIRGDADPTWWTCSSALGRPATKAREVGSGCGASVVTAVSVPDAVSRRQGGASAPSGTRWRARPRPG